MPLNHPTDSSYVLDDGLTQFSPTGPGVTAGVFNASTKSSSIALSESNRTASLASGGAYHMARGDTQIAGEAYFEFTLLGVPTTTAGNIGIGLINAALTNYDVALTTVNTAGFFAPNNSGGGGGGYAHATGYGINGSGYTSVLSGQEWTVGLVIGMAVSMSDRTVMITLDGITWSPAMDITALGTTIYPGVCLYNSGDSIRMNAGNQPFVYTVPSGYAGMDISTTTYYGFGQVGGVTKVFDVGEETVPSGWLAQFEFSQIDKTAGENNTYYFVMAGSNDPTMSTYEEVSNRWQASIIGTKPLVAFSTLSRASNTLLRYFAVLKILSGSSPSVTAYCFMEPLGDLSLYTVNEAIQILCFMSDNDVAAFAQFRAWMTGVAWGGVNGDGIYPVSDGYGNITYLKSPAQLAAENDVARPEYYGAIGDGASHPASGFYATLTDLQAVYSFASSLTQEMDFLAWQKAINTGLKLSSLPNDYVMCNTDPDSQTPLIFVSGLAWVEADRPRWDFTTFIAKTTDVHLYDNYDFATDDGWENATIWSERQFIPTTFGGGEATMTDIGSQTSWTIGASAADSSWRSVCWSPELAIFCAVGAAGGVMTSPNGITWTLRTAASSNDWNSVCWSLELGLFVAVASTGTGTRVMTSANGTSWTTRTSASDSFWRSVCWSPELTLFVAVSSSGNTSSVMTSPDGITWTTQTTPNTNQWLSVCWAAEIGLFCAVSITGTGNRVMTSPDGITWTARTSVADNTWLSVCWSAQRLMFVAVAGTGTGNRVMTSYDGINWTERTSAADNYWSSVCWSVERRMFVAVAASGTGNRVMESKDGIAWYTRTSAADNGWSAVCYAPDIDLFVAVANTGTGNRVMSAIVHDSFFQWGRHLVDIPVGHYTVTWEAEATLGGSYEMGNFNPPYLQISFFANSPGDGPNLVGRDSGTIRFDVFLAGGAADVKGGNFDFDVPSVGSVWLTVSAGGYGDIKVTKLDVQPALLNCAVLMTRDDAPSYYSIMQPLTGVWIYGPGTTSGVTGVLWKSFVSTDGNVPALERCNVIGFEYGIETSDGAYLTEIKSCNIFSNKTGYRHRIGGINSGENIRLSGGGIFNNEIGIDNSGGAEINVVHTAIDYNGQAIINNAGTINLSLLRLEQWIDGSHPSPILHCLPGGKITCSQMRLLGAGSPGTATVPPVKLDSALSSCTFDMCDIYNLSSSTGYSSTGPGLLRIKDLQNNGNPHIGPVLLSAAPAMDILAGAGFFEPQISYVAVAADGIYLEGGLFPDPPHTSLDRWNSDITTIEVSTDYAYQGTRSLKITKATSPDLHINDQLHFLIPNNSANLLGGFKVLMPYDQATTGTIYYRLFWVRVIGHDSLGRPIYGPNQVYKGETDIPVPLTGSLTWITRSFGTLYENDSPDPAAQSGIRPPVWATHLLLLFDHMANPAMTYYIDALQANEVG